MKRKVARHSPLVPAVFLAAAAICISTGLVGCSSDTSATADTKVTSPGKPAGGGTPPPSLPTTGVNPQTPQQVQDFARKHGYSGVTIKGAK